MFAILALAGDLGCSAGPGLVGFISDAVQRHGTSLMPNWVVSTTERGLKTGLLIAIAFPFIMCMGVLILRYTKIHAIAEKKTGL